MIPLRCPKRNTVRLVILPPHKALPSRSKEIDHASEERKRRYGSSSIATLAIAFDATPCCSWPHARTISARYVVA